MDTHWHYNGSPLSEDFRNTLIEEGVIGFIYCITETSTQKKYVGKKMWITKRKLPPLKGKTRKRSKIVETDWRTYYGSSENVKELIEERGVEEFHREILHFCHNKAELAYLETKEQIERNVLLDDEYYNGIVACKVNGVGLKRLKELYNAQNGKRDCT